MTVKKFFIVVFIVVLFVSVLLADYRSIVLAGNNAYKIGDYSGALELYKQAYDIKPSKQLAYFIKKLEAEMGPASISVDPRADWAKQENVLCINLMPIIYNQINISYKRALGSSFSIGVSAFYTWNSGQSIFAPDDLIYIGSANHRAYGGGIDADLYAENKSPNGLYGGFGINIGYSDYRPFGYRETVMANLHVGYRWIFKWGGSVEIQAAYTLASKTMTYMPYLMGNTLNVGWAF